MLQSHGVFKCCECVEMKSGMCVLLYIPKCVCVVVCVCVTGVRVYQSRNASVTASFNVFVPDDTGITVVPRIFIRNTLSAFFMIHMYIYIYYCVYTVCTFTTPYEHCIIKKN